MRMSVATKLAAVAGAVVVAAGGVATAALADSGGSATPTASATAASVDSHPDASPKGLGRAWLAEKGVHGEFVARTADGFKTFATQRGTVTAVSSSSLTVRSDDGYVGSYSVTDNTVVRQNKNKTDISAVKVGAKVRVGARVDGQSRTALRVIISAG
ncbi:DUF5666 domain-containing protein [Frankia sp. Cr2]|uniref:DUF5666 domain-containing protein n=1 Tax=Frankia sp. Cr2 TaxID=3073932 RepID=UPI002AD1E80A|nr:DUF5666 domain-containing protein [Frankia sp. Cr2]